MEFVRDPPGFAAILWQGTCSDAMKHRVVLSKVPPNFDLHSGRGAFRAHKPGKLRRALPPSGRRTALANRVCVRLSCSSVHKVALEGPLGRAIKISWLRIDLAPQDSCARRALPFRLGEVCARDFCARRALPGRRLPALKKKGPYPERVQGIGRVMFVQLAAEV